MKPCIVIKIGGRSVENEKALNSCIREIKDMGNDFRFVFVHGGGKAVSELQDRYGLKPEFRNGLRMTSSVEMDLVDMGLSGLMNTRLVRTFQKADIRAVGLSGADAGLIQAESVGEHNGEKNRTGNVSVVDTRIAELLLDNGYLPVICSVSTDVTGTAMNVNADEAAFALASALQAQVLVFLTDIPGVVISGVHQHHLMETVIEVAIKDKEITGGMVPKTLSSLVALKEGVKNVVIGQYRQEKDLSRLIRFESGTRITLE
jgi:acetylglutamate kinase